MYIPSCFFDYPLLKDSMMLLSSRIIKTLQRNYSAILDLSHLHRPQM